MDKVSPINLKLSLVTNVSASSNCGLLKMIQKLRQASQGPSVAPLRCKFVQRAVQISVRSEMWEKMKFQAFFFKKYVSCAWNLAPI